MKLFRFVFLLAFFLIAGLDTATAERALPDISVIEKYLDGITTLRARFTQISEDGAQAPGTFLLKRPGRMRFEYAPPAEDFIVADGIFIYYYDGQLKQQSNTPISRSLADFFLRENLKLSGDIRVSDYKRKNGTLQVALQQAAEPEAGTLTLIFSEKPLALQKWRIVDAQGLVTEVALSEIESGIRLDNKLFFYYDPERKTDPYPQK